MISAELIKTARKKALWLAGKWAVPALADILADPDRADIHGPAATALTLCAYSTFAPGDLESETAERRQALRWRNQQLAELRLEYRNENDLGYTLLEDQATVDRKRNELLALYATISHEYHFSLGDKWLGMISDTGWVDFFK